MKLKESLYFNTLPRAENDFHIVLEDTLFAWDYLYLKPCKMNLFINVQVFTEVENYCKFIYAKEIVQKQKLMF